MTKRPRLVLANAHKIFLDGLQRTLSDKFEVIGTAINGRDFISMVLKLRPDLALMAISMPEVNGIEALRELGKCKAPVKVIVLTRHHEVAIAAEAFRAGASGYVLKDAEPEELVRAIREVLAGRFYLTPSIAKATLHEFMAQQVSTSEPRLTPRQQQVLKALVEGHRIKEIASRLNISISTVEYHKTELMRRLGAATVADLIRYSLDREKIEVSTQMNRY